MTASERRSEIIRILVERKIVTVERLATELSVSKRTIMYDLDALTGHYPISMKRGRSGGVCLENWYAPKGLLSEKHQRVLIDLLPRANEYEQGVLCEMLRVYGSADIYKKMVDKNG